MKFKRRKIKRGRVEIIPMIDTIVILLVFYMTFSRFAEANHESSLQLPFSKSGDEFKRFPYQLIVNMFSSDDISIGGNHYKVAELPRVMWEFYSYLHKSDPETANAIKSGAVKPSIILRGSRTMTYKDLSDFMKTCAKADLREFLPERSPIGVTEVTFTTMESNGK